MRLCQASSNVTGEQIDSIRLDPQLHNEAWDREIIR